MRSYARSRAHDSLLAEMGPGAAIIGQLLEAVSPEIANLPAPPALEP
jgi:hypothetical protein